MTAPEKWRNKRKQKILSSLIRRHKITLKFRTLELCEGWKQNFTSRDVVGFSVLPSLEVPNIYRDPVDKNGCICRNGFLVIGQLRPGKEIEKIIALFESAERLSDLKIIGSFVGSTYRDKCKSYIDNNIIDERFMTSLDMEEEIKRSSYVVLTYGGGWDSRMESGLLYFAARLGTPVIAYNKGWIARIVIEYKLGILVDDLDTIGHFTSVPQPGTFEYTRMVNGCIDFCEENLNSKLVNMFVDDLLRS